MLLECIETENRNMLVRYGLNQKNDIMSVSSFFVQWILLSLEAVVLIFYHLRVKFETEVNINTHIGQYLPNQR